MRVEMLRARGYRGQHLDAGLVLDMDEPTASVFIAKGWAKRADEPPPVITTEEADALVPTQIKRRNAKR